MIIVYAENIENVWCLDYESQDILILSRKEFAEPLNQFFSVHYFGEDLNFRKIKVLSVTWDENNTFFIFE